MRAHCIAIVDRNLRSGSRLSSLALQSANSLLSPLGSHLGLQEGSISGWFKDN